MSAAPWHCDRCGKEWWWEVLREAPDPPPCSCGGSFTEDAPPRCPSCRSVEITQDPDGISILYD